MDFFLIINTEDLQSKKIRSDLFLIQYSTYMLYQFVSLVSSQKKTNNCNNYIFLCKKEVTAYIKLNTKHQRLGMYRNSAKWYINRMLLFNSRKHLFAIYSVQNRGTMAAPKIARPISISLEIIIHQERCVCVCVCVYV